MPITPYAFERHLNLLSYDQHSELTSFVNIGVTVDGRDFDHLIIEDKEYDQIVEKNVWIITRQHPGETKMVLIEETYEPMLQVPI